MNLFLYGLVVSLDFERNVPVRIQKPRVVSNNSVNINFSKKVIGTKSLACEMIQQTYFYYLFLSDLISFVDIEQECTVQDSKTTSCVK